MKNIFIICLIIVISCRSKNREQGVADKVTVVQKLQVERLNENTFNILLPNGEKPLIINDTIKNTSFLVLNGQRKVQLKYYLSLDYIGEIYWVGSVNTENYLFIESYEYGVSGIAASIVNATLIYHRNNNYEPIYFNSFLWDIDKNINIVSDTLEIEIINLQSRENDIYCATSFYLANGQLYSKGKSICYSLTEKGLIPIVNCDNCIPLQVPFVTE